VLNQGTNVRARASSAKPSQAGGRFLMVVRGLCRHGRGLTGACRFSMWSCASSRQLTIADTPQRPTPVSPAARGSDPPLRLRPSARRRAAAALQARSSVARGALVRRRALLLRPRCEVARAGSAGGTVVCMRGVPAARGRPVRLCTAAAMLRACSNLAVGDLLAAGTQAAAPCLRRACVAREPALCCC
jgi:hypothetical protein